MPEEPQLLNLLRQIIMNRILILLLCVLPVILGEKGIANATKYANFQVKKPDVTKTTNAEHISRLNKAQLVGQDYWNNWRVTKRIRRPNLAGTNQENADLRLFNLSFADLSGANLSYAKLSGASLAKATLANASLFDADLRGADLSYADLRGATLDGADVYGANLAGADLRGAYLRVNKGNLYSTLLRGAIYNRSTIFPTFYDYENSGMEFVKE